MPHALGVLQDQKQRCKAGRKCLGSQPSIFVGWLQVSTSQRADAPAVHHTDQEMGGRFLPSGEMAPPPPPLCPHARVLMSWI